jgi:hypothetical protein
VRRIGAGERVDDVDVAVAEVSDQLRTEPVEAFFLQRTVHGSPADPLLGTGLTDDEAIVRGPAGVAPGVDDERTALAEARLPTLERVRVQERGRGVPEDAPARVEPVRFESS